MLTNERLEEIKSKWGTRFQAEDVKRYSAVIAYEIVPELLTEIERLRASEHEYYKRLLDDLQRARSQGEGRDRVYFSDGLQGSVDTMEKLEAAGLFERIGGGPTDHIFGKLTEDGWRMGGGK